jgi:hypothetical protein
MDTVRVQLHSSPEFTAHKRTGAGADMGSGTGVLTEVGADPEISAESLESLGSGLHPAVNAVRVEPYSGTDLGAHDRSQASTYAYACILTQTDSDMSQSGQPGTGV